jgi:hypothetical protein
MSGEYSTPSELKSVSRATQDAIIVSFVAILCSYYWVTVIWPAIQRRREIYNEKLITMEKLLKKQQTSEIETSKSEDYEIVKDNNSTKDASFKKVTAKFNLRSTVKKNPEGNISEDDVSKDIIVPMKGEYVLKESIDSFSATDRGFHAQIDKDIQEGFVTALHSDEVFTVELRDVENHEKAKSTVSKATRKVLPIRQSKLVPKAANAVENSHGEGRLEDEQGKKIATDHRVLWSHISRTTSNVSYNTYSDTDSNPWSHSTSATSMSNIEGLNSEHSDPQVGTLTYLEARELRIQQDAEYALSLAAAATAGEEKSKIEKLAEIEVLPMFRLQTVLSIMHPCSDLSTARTAENNGK